MTVHSSLGVESKMKTLLSLTALHLVFGLPLNCSSAKSAGPFPRLLPPAQEFDLVLREDQRSQLPLGPSCDREASRTLMCRAFTVTLKNVGAHTVRISGLNCFEPPITFERIERTSSNGWWPLSQPGTSTCKTLDWTDTRLRPGEQTQYSTRLLSQRRWIQSVGPGQYTIRAQWVLKGCTEAADGHDCLAPLQDVHQFGTPARVDFQEPVIVESKEITVESPELGNLGVLNFGFDVTLNTPPERDPACSVESTGFECAVFHYAIRNLGNRPVRNGTFSCSDSGIQPEYRLEASEWKPVPQMLWVCSMNVLIEKVILPGQTVGGTFTLLNLRPGYDMTALQAPGVYQFRFTLWPSACIAAPDGSFCLTRPEKQPTVASKELTLRKPNPQPSPD